MGIFLTDWNGVISHVVHFLLIGLSQQRPGRQTGFEAKERREEAPWEHCPEFKSLAQPWHDPEGRWSSNRNPSRGTSR